MPARTCEHVQQPMEYDAHLHTDPATERASETGRQKGFMQAKDIESVINRKNNKVRQEIDAFMQWDEPREER